MRASGASRPTTLRLVTPKRPLGSGLSYYASPANDEAHTDGMVAAMAGELLEFPHGVTGIVLNLEEDNVGVALFGGCNAAPDIFLHGRGHHTFGV